MFDVQEAMIVISQMLFEVNEYMVNNLVFKERMMLVFNNPSWDDNHEYQVHCSLYWLMAKQAQLWEMNGWNFEPLIQIQLEYI